MSYRNTYQCECRAIVGIGTRWMTGWWAVGDTSDRFQCAGAIPAGHCPICRRQMKCGLWFWDSP